MGAIGVNIRTIAQDGVFRDSLNDGRKRFDSVASDQSRLILSRDLKGSAQKLSSFRMLRPNQGA